MALSRIFDISKRSLSAYQKAMDVAAHNISNAGNPNYSRQRISITADDPQSDTRFQWGSGIKVANLARVQDDLLSSQIILNTQKYHNYNKQSELLSQIEVVFGEPTEYGMANYLNKFFDAWSSLSVSPNAIEARKEIIFAAENLSSKVDNIYSSIENVKRDIENTFVQRTKDVNNILNEIKDLNAKIFQASQGGSSANDLLDKRDRLLNDLSKITSVKVQKDQRGVATVYVGGVFAVNMDAVTEFKVVKREDGSMELRTVTGNVKAVINQGEMAGLVTTYNDKLNDYTDKIDKMMSIMVEEVNAIHEKGYTIDAAPQTGIKFFDGYENGRLKINKRVVLDPLKIAVSSDGTSGNGEYAVSLANLKDKKSIDGMSIMEYYGNIVNDIGNAVNSSNSKAESTDLVLQQLQSQKDSVTAVSIDEEMTNILSYQKSFNASAKMIKIADEMMQTLLNMV